MHKHQARIETYLKQGWTPRQIIRKLPSLQGRNSLIANLRKKLGIPSFSRARPPGYLNPKSRQKRRFIVGMRRQGMTITRIAKLMGMSKQGVAWHLAHRAIRE